SSDVVLVDLSGRWPRLAGTLTVDGSLVDARQVGGAARVVVRSTPRVAAGDPAAIDGATISDWLPRYRLSVDGRTTSGRVGCQQVSRPLHYSGLTMLTVYTVDLDAASVTIGEPATVVADGGVVYGTGDSLYIAAADRWMAVGTGGQLMDSSTNTQIYKFDVSRPGRPVFEASGEVPGSLINQYAMSEYDGKLRVVTTTAGAIPDRPQPAPSESALHVLQQRGDALNEIGRLGGLGRGERVYSVRFVGATGYVVTFRQTDPLYVVDLRDPANPAAVGELQLTGYSAYLHPAGDGRLIGVGQEANARGRVLGTQVSLFDVGDPSRPGLIARYQLNGGRSEAEVDPHAFLFWPKTGLVLIPITPSWNGALALTIDGASIHELGRVGPGRQIRRSLVVGDTLWTVTDTGLGTNQVTTLTGEGWIPFSLNG
ncbi:MAG TPA: beta-propeller domain-containing protein, partial [Candidatus Eisenbacteria bacterium]|nr:beta-propeller domain-containing protein [Candidatus Eisenbacteria bacterium]